MPRLWPLWGCEGWQGVLVGRLVKVCRLVTYWVSYLPSIACSLALNRKLALSTLPAN